MVGDGGHYDNFGSLHDVNYHLRTVAHNTIRVIDPNESWEVRGRDSIRAGRVTANDGGQRYDWPQHNGAVYDAAQWNAQKEIWKTGEILAFEDKGDHVFIKADCAKAYSANKLETFIRQIVYLRPGTFIIVDTVRVKDPAFKVIWNLQAMKRPIWVGGDAGNDVGLWPWVGNAYKYTHPIDDYDGGLGAWTWSNGNGRLFLQTLLPEKTNVELFSGDNLYTIDGVNYPPQNDTGPAPECRMEISPTEVKKDHLFVHVLRATEAGVEQVPLAKAVVSENKIRVELDAEHSLEFDAEP